MLSAAAPTATKNQYLVLRHGHSVGNLKQVIASDPQTAIEQFGLTERGHQEVSETISSQRDRLKEVAQIYASDFLRTRQTAELVADELTLPLTLSPKLRERYFGDWEGTSTKNYPRVWEADANDSDHQMHQVESVQQVAKRMLNFVAQQEHSHSGMTILLVSHGDPLQILLTAMQGKPLTNHRSGSPMRTAELRQFDSRTLTL